MLIGIGGVEMINPVDSFELLTENSAADEKCSFCIYRYKCLLDADDLTELLSTVKSKIESIHISEDSDVGMHTYGGDYTYTGFLEFLTEHNMNIYSPDCVRVRFNDGIVMFIEWSDYYRTDTITVYSSADFDIVKYFIRDNRT